MALSMLNADIITAWVDTVSNIVSSYSDGAKLWLFLKLP